MNFAQSLEKIAKENNVDFRICNEFHIQLRAVYVVNVYEGKSKYYVSGANASSYFSKSKPLHLVNIALGINENLVSKKTKREKVPAGTKRNLWIKSKDCFFCKGKIESFSEASIEHVIPLAKGGSNRIENLALSHEKCNHERGSSMAIKETASAE